MFERLEFNDNLAKGCEIGCVGLFQAAAFVKDGQLLLRFERNTSVRQLDLERLLIHGFKETRTEFVVNLHRRADHRIDFFPAKQFGHSNHLVVICTHISVDLRYSRIDRADSYSASITRMFPRSSSGG